MVDENQVAEDQPLSNQTAEQYNDVDTSDYNLTGGEDRDPVNDSTPEEQSTISGNNNEQDSFKNSTEQSEEGSDESDEYDYELEIDGQTYSIDDVMNWKIDADNKENWQASNTQKAQQLSQLGRLFEQIKGDSEFQEYINDYYHNNPNGLKDSGLKDIEWNNIPDDLNPDDYLIQDDPQNVLMERVEALETEKNVQILESQLETLEEKFPDLLGNQKTDAFLQFVDEAGIGDLEVGFRLWATDALLGQHANDRKLAENKERNAGRVISKQSRGARNVVQDTKGTRDWRKVSLDDPEISKYFDN